MALDRQSIEKKDFPMGRRGYDPEAVDAHLSAVADEVADVTSSAGGQTASLAASASEQVRAIVDAAETTAAQIRGDAEREAKKILADARRELRKARDEASSQATEHVAKVAQSAAAMLERIDAMEQEITTLVDTLRGGADRLGADLQLLEGSLGDVTAAISPEKPEEDDEPEVVVAAVVVDDEEEELELEDEAGSGPETELAATAVAESPSVIGAEEDEDLEGARLIALNMALNGNSREDIDHYLAENFDLVNRDALLDEVYASVEG